MSAPPAHPRRQAQAATPGQSAVTGCGTVIGVYLVWYLILTPLILLAWNIGLENAGIVPNEIDWMTALGLAFCLGIVRGLLAATRRPIIYNVPPR